MINSLGVIIKECSVKPPKLRVVRQRVIWSFADNEHNPLMRSVLERGEGRARLTSSAMIFQNGENNAQSWRVALDAEGYVLRQNGRPHLINGEPVNALARRKNSSPKAYLSFWDLVFQRDKAPIEGRTELGFEKFVRSLGALFYEGNRFLLDCYCRARVGKRGEIRLPVSLKGTPASQSCLWGLSLKRNYAGREIGLFPLEAGNELSLALYDVENHKWISAFCFDREEELFFGQKARGGEICREYYLTVPKQRKGEFAGLDFYFNQRAVIGDIYVLEADELSYCLRRGDQSIYMPLFEIKADDSVTGYLAGDMWPQRKTDISGKVSRGAAIHWDPRDNLFTYKVFGKMYRLLKKDAAYLGVKDGDDVLLSFENGFVVEAAGRLPGRKVYYRLARDKNWQVISASRTAIDQSVFRNHVVILEGLESVRHKGAEGALVAGSFLSFGRRAEGPFAGRPVSVVVRIENGRKRILYCSTIPRFSSHDREIIDKIIDGSFDSYDLSDRAEALTRQIPQSPGLEVRVRLK